MTIDAQWDPIPKLIVQPPHGWIPGGSWLGGSKHPEPSHLLDYNVELEASLVEGWHLSDMPNEGDRFQYVDKVVGKGGGVRAKLSLDRLKR